MDEHERRRQFGAYLTGLRHHTGKSQSQLAALLSELSGTASITRHEVSRWERGARIPDAWLPDLAQALSRPLAELERAAEYTRNRTAEAPPGDANALPVRAVRPVPVALTVEGDSLTVTVTDGEDSAEVDRRQFLGVFAVAATEPGALSGIANARHGIDTALTGSNAGDLAYLESAFERHRGGYRGRPPTAVLGQMRDDLDLLRDVLNRPHPTATRAQLARTAAGIAGLVAIIQHDRGDQREAHRWFATAERAARESGDRQMLAWTLARHAMVPLNYGAPEAAAGLAFQARSAAGRTLSASAALAAAVSARALAAKGDRQGALREVADARTIAEQLDGSQAADTWFGYPLQKHHVHLSQAFTLLGSTEDAYAEQDAALALTGAPSVMTRALLDIDRATCLSVDGDSGYAAEKAAGVWAALPEPYRSGLVRERAAALCDTISGTAPEVAQELRSTFA